MWDFFAKHQVDPNVATYTARFTATEAAALAAIARARGESVADVVRFGVDALRAVADDGRAVPLPPPANDGPAWVTVAWELGAASDIDADAAEWGLSGAELHAAGGRLVNLIVYLAAAGRL
jgi:hypothetical protein